MTLAFITDIQFISPDRPVSASPNSLFNGLPSRLRPFWLQFSTAFAITLLLFIAATGHGQLNLYLLSFSSTGSTFSSSRTSSFLFVVEKGVAGRSLQIFRLDLCQSFL